MKEQLLQVKDLHVHFPIKENPLKKTKEYVKAVNGIDLSNEQGKTLGIVGESGCGKSTLARTIVGLEEPTSGDILFEGNSIRSEERRVGKETRSRAMPNC